MNPPDSFWQRLKQRRIVQWTVAYVAGTVVLLEFSDYLRSAFGLSQVAMTVLTVLVAFGFLAMLVLAWYHGESGQQRVRSTEVILLTGIAIIAGIVAWQLGTQAAQRATRFRGGGRSTIGPAAVDSMRLRRSIAVLPFDNLSADAGNDFFSDGVTADIIAALGHIRDVRVISRTSVMPYKGVTDRSLRQIARELNVGYVVEGSVQRTGDRVRINATLIDVDADDDVWTYQRDHDLEDILSVQTAVSREVAEALQAQLDPESVPGAFATTKVDPRANDRYYEGMRLAESEDPAERARALELFEQAIEIDSTFEKAWAALARTALSAEVDPIQLAAAPENTRADSVIRRGLTRRPEAPEMRMYALRRDIERGDATVALDSVARIVEANRNSATAHHVYGLLLARERRYDEALAELREAELIDPHSTRVGATIGELLHAMGEQDEAIAQLRATLDRDPDHASARLTLGLAYQAKGMADSALAQLRQAEAATRGSRAHAVYAGTLGQVLAVTGNTTEAGAMLDSLIARVGGRGGRDGGSSIAIAQILVGLDRSAEALEWLERDRSCSPARFSPRVLGSLEPLREDPRFREWLRRDCGSRDGGGGRSGRGGRGGRG